MRVEGDYNNKHIVVASECSSPSNEGQGGEKDKGNNNFRPSKIVLYPAKMMEASFSPPPLTFLTIFPGLAEESP